METMSELQTLLDDLADCGRKLTRTAEAIRELYSMPEGQTVSINSSKKKQSNPAEPGKNQPPEQAYTKEAVRAILAKKANESDGKYKKEVRAIVKKYGHGGSLTDIDPKDYPAVVKEAEGLSYA